MCRGGLVVRKACADLVVCAFVVRVAVVCAFVCRLVLLFCEIVVRVAVVGRLVVAGRL